MGSVPMKRRARVRYGLGQPPPLSDDGVPILRATNIERGRIHARDLIRASIEDLPLDRTPLLEAGEVLVVRSGAYTGDSALVTERWAGSAPGYDLRLTPLPDLVPKFLAYSLLGQRARDEIDLSKTRAAQPHLNAEDLAQVRLRDCSVEEQERTVAYLDCETAKIDAMLKEQVHLQDLVREHIDAAIDEAIWARCDRTIPLGQLTPRDRQIMYGIVLPGPDVADGVLLVKGGDVKPGRLDPGRLSRTTADIEANYRRSRLRPNDVVYAIRGSIGDAELVPSLLDGANITQDVARISPLPTVDARWLCYAVRSRRFFGQMESVARGATIRGINIWSLKRGRVPWVDLADQARVADALDVLAAQVNQLDRELQQQMALLREHRNALITSAVTEGLDGMPGVT